MKKKDLKFSNDIKTDGWLKGCFFNEWSECYKECLAILDKAEDSGQVIKMVLESDTMKGSQIYAELSKREHYHWFRVQNSISNWVKTYSDAGGLKIGNDDFSITVPNGYGDGDMRYAVVDKGCLNHNMLEFWTSIQGHKINIYEYDCGTEEDVIETLNGRFGVFYGYGFVVFERWGEAK